ncbi:MAG: cation:proton antiporter [Arcticibacter sp.]
MLMVLLSNLEFTLPLRNPVMIFSLVLFIILFAPILFNKIKVPHIIGLIIAGVIVGPYGLNLLTRDSSIVLFGTVGLLYIMFLAGLEIDISEFKKNRNKIVVFGLTTFLLPLIVGSLASYYVLGYGLLSSVLLASMFSTHTLIAYPIASRYGISKNRAVTLTIGGTMITDILALLILAAIAGVSKGDVSSSFWVQLGGSCIMFVCVVFFLFPPMIRWFFKKFEDSISQYIFVLAIVFLSSFLAEAAGIEAIIGAFFSGLVLNKFVPHSSPLMNRIDFVGNALFIPFFLIGVGMLVDIRVLFNGVGALKVAGVIVLVAVLTKYLAALFTQKIFKLSAAEGKMIFGLSTSHAAATLAIILVGYNIIVGETAAGEPIRLLNEDVLNGTIILILVSCAISSFVVEKASQTLALEEESMDLAAENTDEKILISLAYPETVQDLVDLGLILKPRKSNIPVYALHIVSDENTSGSTQVAGRKMMDKAISHAAASENTLEPLTRYDINVSNAITYTIKEHAITDVLIGLHRHSSQLQFLGPVAGNILQRVNETVYIYKPLQPINTLNRIVAAVPPKAELEPGFIHWLGKVYNIAREAALPLVFYANEATMDAIQTVDQTRNTMVVKTFQQFSNWEDFLILSRELKQNDLFLIISSRKGHISYTRELDKLPYYLHQYFNSFSLLMIFPKQLESGINMTDIEQADGNLIEVLADKIGTVGRAGSILKGWMRRK